MRCDQYMGLTEAAQALVLGARAESAGTFSGMFGDEYPLYRYILPDGRVFIEAVQADPWSSGPVFFLALRENGKWVEESFWAEEEIERA